MKQVLFIQGAGRGAHAADAKLVASLRLSLGRSHRVRYPKMPEAAPEYESWRARIANALAALDGPVILVGHSLGGSVLLKYASEETIEAPVSGIFLVAAPFWGAKGWRHEPFTLRRGFASTLPRGTPIFLYHSRDDEEVPFAHVNMYARRLPRAKVGALNARGHQLGNDLSEVTRDILTLG